MSVLSELSSTDVCVCGELNLLKSNKKRGKKNRHLFNFHEPSKS